MIRIEDKKTFLSSLAGLSQDYVNKKCTLDADLCHYAEKIDKLPKFIANADAEFEDLTRLSKTDMSFLVFASTMQVVRQMITSHLKTRLTDKEAAKRVPFHTEEHSNRSTRLYYATKAEIVSNPVPFDAIRKSEVVKFGGNPKLNGFNHRYKAIGHDPLLGLIFGTANIMTKTITVANGAFSFETYHVGSGIASNGSSEYKVDMLTNHASTWLMFEHIYARIKEEGMDAWMALAVAMGKELEHLITDLSTDKSLPIPVVSAVSPNASRILNLCGVDALSAATFGIDMFISKMIDIAIAYIHQWCYNPEADGPIETYQVRTKNIVYYSNLVSLASTTIQTLCRAYMGDTTAMSKFDFGGALSAWKVVWNTQFIISDMKSEYIRNKTVKYLSE